MSRVFKGMKMAGHMGARRVTETGLTIQVPIFVDEGDTIRVDTRTGEYQTRL